MAAAFAATFLPAYDPADWANNYERPAAAQQRERQYIADYYARTTGEQEERENREACERFAGNAGRAAIAGLTHFCIVYQVAGFTRQSKTSPALEESRGLAKVGSRN